MCLTFLSFFPLRESYPCSPLPRKKDHLDPEAREAARIEAARLTRLIISHAARASRLKSERRGGLSSSNPGYSYFIYNHEEINEEDEEADEEDGRLYCSWHS